MHRVAGVLLSLIEEVEERLLGDFEKPGFTWIEGLMQILRNLGVGNCSPFITCTITSMIQPRKDCLFWCIFQDNKQVNDNAEIKVYNKIFV